SGNHKINFNQPDGFGHLESEGQEFYGFDRVRSVMDGVVLTIAYPSLRLLYLIDEVEGPSVTLNVLGHQWYWEYSLANIEVSSVSGMPWQHLVSLGTDTLTDHPTGRPLLPNLLVSSGTDASIEHPTPSPLWIFEKQLVLRKRNSKAGDVIHSWALPELGVKVDAVPGRLNQVQRPYDRRARGDPKEGNLGTGLYEQPTRVQDGGQVDRISGSQRIPLEPQKEVHPTL
ncbi:unnamed protein product, partial [Cyprideis torosa]